jgi:hypothetical protein
MSKAPPRGPRGGFLLGSGPELARDQLGFYAACARDWGDVVPARLGPRRALLVYHPDAIEEILVTRNRDFVTYTAMVVNEAMRLYPPAYAVGREVSNPTEVAGHALAPGGIVIIPTWVVHRDRDGSTIPRRFAPSGGRRSGPKVSCVSPTSHSVAGRASASATGSR